MKSFIIVLFSLLLIFPGLSKAQENSEAISQFRKTVFKLQQEMLEIKNELDRQAKELQSQKEELALQVDRLNVENEKFKKHLLEMDSMLFQMEDRLDSSSLIKLSKELQNLRDFNQAVILDSINQPDQSEKILLDILNQPDTRLPKDLLILILAKQKRHHQHFDESISYYSTLLSEFFNSPYFSQAIFEMSEVLGEMGKPEQQLTLLAQLSSLSETDRYSLLAQEKLKELGAETLFEEDALKPDTTTDVKADNKISQETLQSSKPDASSDQELAVPPVADATSDQLPISVVPVEQKSNPDTSSDSVEPPSPVSTSESVRPVPAPAETIESQGRKDVDNSEAGGSKTLPTPKNTDVTADAN